MDKLLNRGNRQASRGRNARRNRDVLARQRDMVPVTMGAACAAVVMHALIWLYCPSVLLLGLDSLKEMPKVEQKVEDIRLIVKPPKEEKPRPEDQTEVQDQLTPPEPEKIEPKPEEIDILDFEGKELLIAHVPTDLDFGAPVIEEKNALTNQDFSPAQLDAKALEPELSLREDAAIPEPTPVNSNEVVVAATAQPEALEDASSLMEEDLRKAAAEGNMSNLPGDTRSLSQLMGMENLGSKSGVARLGADVLFGFNECKLKNSARITMLQLAALIQKNPETYFVIEGHTDSIGGAAYNALLGLQRAAAVRAWLQGNGVPVEHVYIRSCGDSMPVVPTTADREGQALNRRVDIHMRAGGEDLPSGCCNAEYAVDLETKISQQLASGVKVPETPSFRLPVGATVEQRLEAEAQKPAPQKAAQNRAKPAPKPGKQGRPAKYGKQGRNGR